MLGITFGKFETIHLNPARFRDLHPLENSLTLSIGKLRWHLKQNLDPGPWINYYTWTLPLHQTDLSASRALTEGAFVERVV